MHHVGIMSHDTWITKSPLVTHHSTRTAEFVAAWNRHTDGSETVSGTALRKILRIVNAPLGLGQYASALDVDK
jgi:hypothetical protein